MSRLALGCAFNLTDMFMNMPLKKLKMNCYQCKELIGTCHRDKLASKIFTSCLKLVIEDIVQNNVTFWFPMNGIRKCNMHMKKVEGDAFKNLRRKGKWLNVDFLASDFSGYEIRLFMLGNRTPREKIVYVTSKYKNVITEKTNQCFAYGDSKYDKYLKDYLDLVCALYPKVLESDIKKILNFGWKSLYLHNSYGGDTLITNASDVWVYIGRLKYKPLDHFYYYIRRLTVKLRVMYKRKKVKWDGYYYFALSNSRYEYYLSLFNKRGPKRKTFDFGSVFLYEILDECRINEHYKKYIFRVPYISYIKTKFFARNLKTDKAELIEIREPMKFKDISVWENKYSVL